MSIVAALVPLVVARAVKTVKNTIPAKKNIAGEMRRSLAIMNAATRVCHILWIMPILSYLTARRIARLGKSDCCFFPPADSACSLIFLVSPRWRSGCK